MALSQFVEPQSSEQVEKMLAAREAQGETVPAWEKEVYRSFKPLHPNEIMKLSLDPLKAAKYLRSTCFLARGGLPYKIVEQAIQQQREQALLEQSENQEGASLDPIERIQKRLLPEEQEINMDKMTEYIKLICDDSVPLTDLAKVKIRHGAFYYHRMHRTLPKINSLADLPKLTEMTFVKDRTGEIIGEYSKTEVNAEGQIVKRNRRRLPKKAIPLRLKQAVVAIEDSSFWNFKPEGSADYKGHKGVDFGGIIRAVTSSGSGNVQGASTLTMQLAKNLLLYEDVFREHNLGKRSLLRKLKEYILSFRLENALTKDEILNLYLNTIDFGRRTQGVVMAAQVYFNKSLEDLDLSETAFLAGLPKSPNGLDPQKNYEGAVQRRNLVLKQMRSARYITGTERKETKKKALVFIPYTESSEKEGYAQFYMSAVEKQMKDWLESLKQKVDLGFDITVPINHEYQKWAVESLQRGLLAYERKRGKLTVKPDEDNLPNIEKRVLELVADETNTIIKKEGAYAKVLKELNFPYADGKQFRLGVVLKNNKFGLDDGSLVNRQPKDRGKNRYKIIEGKKHRLKEWDVVLLQPFPTKKGGVYYRVASFTNTQGGIVVLDNLTGEVLATSGGFSIGAGNRYKGSAGNRAFAAYRQPGSTVKPFTYFFAMESGVSPSEIIQNKDLLMPRKIFNGDRVCDRWNLKGRQAEAPSYSLRQGLEKSKNRLTVNAFIRSLGISDGENLNDRPEVLGRGIDSVLNLMQGYGLYPNLDYACYPILLGAEETRVVDMAGAYAAFANKGIYNKPHTILSVERRGLTAEPFKQGSRVDAAVLRAIQESDGSDQQFNLFRLRTMLQGVVKRGTARSISKWSKIIAGKTGTTNRNKDAWFVGFNKEITIAVWVGNPNNKSLGSSYEGGKLALPIFKDFMEQYYAKYPEKLKDEFTDNVVGGVTARIEPHTGFRVDATFQSDFNYYTGSNRQIPTVKEYYASEQEMNSQVRHYYQGSKAAGSLFFDYLTNEQRGYYKSGYDAQKVQREEYKRLYRSNKDYCEQYQNTEYSGYLEVITACNNAETYKSYIGGSSSFRAYYLNQINFLN